VVFKFHYDERRCKGERELYASFNALLVEVYDFVWMQAHG